MISMFGRLLAMLLAAAGAATASAVPAAAQSAPDAKLVERGKYIATIGGCGDCHTPGYFLGKPDAARALAGSEVGFEIPGIGVFHGPNLTPDKETGLGSWTDQQIIDAVQKGVRPDGRMLAPVMPYKAFAALTPDDAKALVAYMRSLPAVKNQVPGPFGPAEKPTSFVLRVVPPEAK